MYLLHSYTNRLAEEMRERLRKYGIHEHEANLLFGRMTRDFDMWERNINSLITNDEERQNMMNDYDAVSEALDAFIFGADGRLTCVKNQEKNEN